MTRFVVQMTFDLQSRAGLLVSGHLQLGRVGPGMTLVQEGTGDRIRILAVEFGTRESIRENRFTLLVDRTAAGNLEPGSVLTGPEYEAPASQGSAGPTSRVS